MAKTAKRPHKAGFFTKVLILVLLAALGWQLYRLHGQVADARTEQEQLTQQVAAQQQKNDTLQKSIDDGGNADEMEKIARDELGLVSPGEKVFYDVSN